MIQENLKAGVIYIYLRKLILVYANIMDLGQGLN